MPHNRSFRQSFFAVRKVLSYRRHWASPAGTLRSEAFSKKTKRGLTIAGKPPFSMAGSMGLEPTASGVTGRRYNQLNYDPETQFYFNVNETRYDHLL
jgi:hypothetical protein